MSGGSSALSISSAKNFAKNPTPHACSQQVRSGHDDEGFSVQPLGAAATSKSATKSEVARSVRTGDPLRRSLFAGERRRSARLDDKSRLRIAGNSVRWTVRPRGHCASSGQTIDIDGI
eukprot:CAMPEP_0194498478 /NCGR_PEP_ID=MMETSP0253-20130528/15096_1 /TAXON_ID=2966 /ORGANISM="Noctiluca scintillans" /LENGTH=117 /DNA_ID=CAMNT_0039340123 /DNA_START=482 /DNA_END=835 /DNA_ORIENTATION=-